MRRRILAAAAALAATATAATPAHAAPALQDNPLRYLQPTYVTAPANDDRLFVTEKSGTIQVVENGAKSVFANLDPVVRSTGNEQGLLSMAFAPDYASSGKLYVYYTRNDGAIVVGELQRSASDPDRVASDSPREVLVVPHPDAENHNGGQVQFGPDGFLYAATGDGGGRDDLPKEDAQVPGSRLGKLIRLDPRAPDGAPEIWSSGLRNPWRFSFDRRTGDLWIGDVGQDNWEEIDRATYASGLGRGANYGWRCFEGRHRTANVPACEVPGKVDPVHEYAHGNLGISVAGGYVVRDPSVPTLNGCYVFTDTYVSEIRALDPTRPATAFGTGMTAEFVVSFGEDAAGHVHVVTMGGPDAPQGKVRRIVETGSASSRCPESANAPAIGQQEPPPPPPPPAGDGGTPGPTPPAPPPAADRRAPRLTVRIGSTKGLRGAGRVRPSARCDEACTVRMSIAVSGLRGRSRAKPVAVAAGRTRRVALRLTRRQRASLGRRIRRGQVVKVRVYVHALDAAGNAGVVVRTLRVRRAT